MNMDQIVKSLQACHPLLRGVTLSNLRQYLAFLTPHVIVKEMQREDSLLDNPVAKYLAGEPGALILQHFQREQAEDNNYFVLNEILLDQVLITRHPAIRQIVLLDTIMDTRAYRISELADSCVYEIHKNQVILEEKERCIRAGNVKLAARERHAILVHMHNDEWLDDLANYGFDSNEPTLWTIGNAISHMPVPRAMEFLAHIARLSAPNSQIYADMRSGHGLDWRKTDGNGSPVHMDRGLGEFEMYGDDARVFSAMSKWQVELIARRDGEQRYFGTMWDQDKLGRLCVTDPKEAHLGPWYMVRFTKPDFEDADAS